MNLTPKESVPVWRRDGYTLRMARPEDAESYYAQNFNPLDPEAARLTGCRADFSREEVVSFFTVCTGDPERYDLLLIDPAGRIVGESVLNEMNPELGSANFRICLFHPGERGKGIGSWVIRTTRDFAFETLRLRRLELDVFSFNPRAIRAYEAAGFVREGVLRQVIRDGDGYGDDILMAMLEEDWKRAKERERQHKLSAGRLVGGER